MLVTLRPCNSAVCQDPRMHLANISTATLVIRRLAPLVHELVAALRTRVIPEQIGQRHPLHEYTGATPLMRAFPTRTRSSIVLRCTRNFCTIASASFEYARLTDLNTRIFNKLMSLPTRQYSGVHQRRFCFERGSPITLKL